MAYETKEQSALIPVIMASLSLISLALAFIEDAVLIAGFPWEIRRIFIIAGFSLDILFLARFLGLGAAALEKSELRAYLFPGRGWVDMLSSLPVLVFSSGPLVFGIVLGVPQFLSLAPLFGIPATLKAARALKVLRALRALSALEYLSSLKPDDAEKFSSAPHDHESARIRSIAIASAVFILLSSALPGFFSALSGLPLDERSFERERAFYTAGLSRLPGPSLRSAAEIRHDLMLVRIKDQAVFSRLSGSIRSSKLYPDGYREVSFPENEVYALFDSRQANQANALSSLAAMGMSLCFIAGLTILARGNAKHTSFRLDTGARKNGVEEDERETMTDSQAIARLLQRERR